MAPVIADRNALVATWLWRSAPKRACHRWHAGSSRELVGEVVHRQHAIVARRFVGIHQIFVGAEARQPQAERPLCNAAVDEGVADALKFELLII